MNGYSLTTVILDFGGQTGTGQSTDEINGTVVTGSQILSMTYNFADGFYSCYNTNMTNPDLFAQLTLCVGTNNSYALSYTGGQSWANLVSSISNDTASFYNGYASVNILGADDIEPGFDPGETGTVQWVHGYASVSSSPPYINYGSADGCPSEYTGSTNRDAECYNSNWYLSTIFYFSFYGSTAATGAVPEIYWSGNGHANQPVQWANVSAYGYYYDNENEGYVVGLLDESDLNSASNDPQTAWTDLWNAYENYPPSGLLGVVANYMGYSLQIHDAT